MSLCLSFHGLRYLPHSHHNLLLLNISAYCSPTDFIRPRSASKKRTFVGVAYNKVAVLDGFLFISVILETNGVSSITTSIDVFCGPGSVVGIATGYGLDGPGIESQWGARFSAPVQIGPGPTQPPVQWVPGLSRGYRATEA